MKIALLLTLEHAPTTYSGFMQITVDFIDWEIAKEKASKGSLMDDLLDIDGEEEWVTTSKCWLNDSYTTYCSIGEAFEGHLTVLDEKTRVDCQKSLCLLLNENTDFPQELGDALDSEYWVGAISPTTVSRILDSSLNLDLTNIASSIPQDIIEYIKQCIAVLEEAKATGKGILIHVG